MCEKWVITCLFICYSKYAFPGGKKNPIHSFQILQVNTVSSSQTHAAFWCLSTVPTTFRVRSFDSIHVVLLIDGFIAWADGVTKKQMSKKLSGMPDPEPLTDEVGGGSNLGIKVGLQMFKSPPANSDTACISTANTWPQGPRLGDHCHD